jgi:hypothetical protein
MIPRDEMGDSFVEVTVASGRHGSRSLDSVPLA